MEDIDKDRLLYKKMKCIYKNIANKKSNKFTDLFFIEEKINKKGNIDISETFEERKRKYWENRRKYLRTKWLNSKNKLIKSRLFKKEYDKYPFSKLEINGRKIFSDVNEFLNINIENFCKRIYEYVYIKKSFNPKNTKYKYMYVFNFIDNKKEIDYYKIDYLKSININKAEISVYPPKSKSHLDIEPYVGEINIYNNKIILKFDNNNDYISAIFNTDLINSRTKYLVGVGIGIADVNQKIPTAKKVILTKEKIKNYNELYLGLNETEIIRAEENSYKFEDERKEYQSNHLKKYIKKINGINSLFQNLSKQNFYNSFYEQLAFKEFLAINRIFQKLNKGHSYFISDRERILNVLIDAKTYEKYKELYIVMPIYENNNIFEKLSLRALELQKRLLKLSSEARVEIIFVIENCEKEFSLEFKIFLEKAYKTINIYFVLKSDIENRVNSIDFIFTDKKNFSIARLLRTSSSVFHLFKHNINICQYEEMYRKILNRSLSYKDFKKEKICTKQINPILKRLIGKWYLHLYGTQKFWISEINIYKNSLVVLINDNGEKIEGEIINKNSQSIMILEDNKTERMFSIIFDNNISKLSISFLVKFIGKKFSSDLELMSIGIMSRHIIELEKVQEILGDVDEVRLIEKESIQNRLSKYLTEKFYF